MRKWLLLLALFLPSLVHAQGTEIVHFASDPIFCDPTRGFIYFNTTSNVVKYCSALNTWTAVSGGGGLAFNLLSNGTNTTAAMTVGTGASLATSGTGTIAATSVGTGTGLTGSVLTGVNGSAGLFTPVGLNNRDVAGTTDTILCDTATATRDRGITVRYKAATATAVTMPDAGTSGCGNNFTVFLAADAAGTVTVSRTTTSTFDLVDGGSHTTGATSFVLLTGQWARVSSPDNSTWFVQVSSFALNGGGALNGSFTGPTTLTGNVVINAGQNQHNFWVHNGIYWTGTNAANYPFTTPQTTIANAFTLTQLGTRIDLVSGNSFTTSTPTDIGSSTRTITMLGYPDTHWTCTDTAGGTDYCWGLHNASALYGNQAGTQGASRTGGFHLKYDCTAKTSYGLTTVEGLGGVQAYGKVDNLWMEGCPTGTVAGGGSPSIALFNWQGISSMNVVRDTQIVQFANTIGSRFANDGAAAANALGPLVVTNLWNDGVVNTGAVPCEVQGEPNSAILLITFVGGVCHHPGTGKNNLVLDFSLNPAASWGGSTNGTYFEENVNGNGKIVQALDASNWQFHDVAWSALSGDIGFDIAQDVAGGSCSLTVDGLRVSVPAQTAFSNHITSRTMSGFRYYPYYHYGGDSTCSIAPITIDSNAIVIGDATTDTMPTTAKGFIGFSRNGGLTWESNAQNATFNLTVTGTSNILNFPNKFQAQGVFSANGPACTNGELALSANWAATGSATVTAVAGIGQTCMWTITTGTTVGAPPFTVTDTLGSNALPTSTTICEMNIHGGTHTAVLGESFLQTTVSFSAPVFTFEASTGAGTPGAGGVTYFVTRRCGP